MEDLMTNPIVWCIVTICTAGGFLLAIVSLRITRKKKMFSCYRRTYEMIKAGEELIP